VVQNWDDGMAWNRRKQSYTLLASNVSTIGIGVDLVSQRKQIFWFHCLPVSFIVPSLFGLQINLILSLLTNETD
jgi:hypothetical protein